MALPSLLVGVSAVSKFNLSAASLAAAGPAEGSGTPAESVASVTPITSANRTQNLSNELIATYDERVRMALTARYGPELGEELSAEAMAWAWANQERLAELENPIGYLVRVGQSRVRKQLRWKAERARYPAVAPTASTVWVEPALPEALAALDDETRTAIILVHCFEWTYPEVAELLAVPLHTVRNRIHRGLHKLRDDLGA